MSKYDEGSSNMYLGTNLVSGQRICPTIHTYTSAF